MKLKKAQNIIIKFLNHQATSSELDYLDKWLQDSNNEKLFNSYIRTNYAVEYNMKKFNSEIVKAQLLRKIADEKKVFKLKKTRRIIRYVAAAVFIGILTTTYVLRDNIFDTPTETTSTIVNTNTIIPGTNKATLTLEDGSVLALEKGNSYQTQNANSNGEAIVYKAVKNNTKDIVYNYLTIPRGGQFHVVLSDGTEVWLNSESQLKYPVNFLKGVTRQVELIYGEAYFDVSPSNNHSGSKFKVINNSQEVEVLGTEFNIKAYRDENHIYTTLVEGKVSIVLSSVNKILKPSEQAKFNFKENAISVSEVDVYNEISWKEGVFSFKGKTLKEIMKVISRWYDADVVFENKDIESLKFKGVLNKRQSIEEIMSIMKSTTINNYEIKDKTIILK